MGAVVGDLGYLSLFLLAGLALRELVTPLQKLFLPAGLIGGVLALVIGGAAVLAGAGAAIGIAVNKKKNAARSSSKRG